MSKGLKIISSFMVFLTFSACAGGGDDVEEFVVVDPAPVSVEPTFTGKYN